jgi:hypothetical protein
MLGRLVFKQFAGYDLVSVREFKIFQTVLFLLRSERGFFRQRQELGCNISGLHGGK